MNIDSFIEKFDKLIDEYSRILKEVYLSKNIVWVSLTDKRKIGKIVYVPFFLSLAKRFVLIHIKKNLEWITIQLNLIYITNKSKDDQERLLTQIKRIEDFNKSIKSYYLSKYVVLFFSVVILLLFLNGFTFSQNEKDLIISLFTSIFSLKIESIFDIATKTELYFSLLKLLFAFLLFTFPVFLLIANVFNSKRMLFNGADRKLQGYSFKKIRNEWNIKKGCYLLEKDLIDTFEFKGVSETQLDLLFELLVSIPFFIEIVILAFSYPELLSHTIGIILIIGLSCIALFWSYSACKSWYERKLSMKDS